MSAIDVVFCIGASMGFIGGYALGYGRGEIAGVKWCVKRMDQPNPQSEIDELRDGPVPSAHQLSIANKGEHL